MQLIEVTGVAGQSTALDLAAVSVMGWVKVNAV